MCHLQGHKWRNTCHGWSHTNRNQWNGDIIQKTTRNLLEEKHPKGKEALPQTLLPALPESEQCHSAIISKMITMLPHPVKQKPWCKTNQHWWSTTENHRQSNTKNRWQGHLISSRTTAGMRWLWGRVWDCSSCNEDYLCLRWRRRYSIGGCN